MSHYVLHMEQQAQTRNRLLCIYSSWTNLSALDLQRCHPRYTLGWRHREVQLHRDGLIPPRHLEYIHAYCDVWDRGRLEQVIATPRERQAVRARAAPGSRLRCRWSGGRGPPGCAARMRHGLPNDATSLISQHAYCSRATQPAE